MKLAIGTVQFGLDYGISNKAGKTPINEVKNILQTAKNAGINTLDTSPAYGNSEQILGDTTDSYNWHIITKTARFTSVDSVINYFKKSLKNLNKQSVYGLLIHNANDIYQDNFKKLYKKLTTLKQQGIIKKLGFSTYTSKQVDFLLENFNFDIIQVPINVFDQRLIKGGQLQKLKQKNIEIHARSIFLQGLLLEKTNYAYFTNWQPHFKHYFATLNKHCVSPLSACLNFVLSLKELDKILVGVINSRQLTKIIIASNNQINLNYDQFINHDKFLINPALWKI